MDSQVTVGKFLARRLVECGVKQFFTVPGDFTLALLDDLCSEPGLQMVGCCNELNAGYAADGYCRESGGIGCLVVTYMVGSLAALSAVAGAYSDNLPLLIVAGSPNSNDESRQHIIHHTIGAPELNQSALCYSAVVAKTICAQHLNEVSGKIDEAFHLCGALRKPVYLEISCDLTTQTVPLPVSLNPSYFAPKLWSDETALASAVTSIVKHVNMVQKVVLIAGSKLRCAGAVQEFSALADALKCGVAVMPDAKGLFSEHHAQYMGCYWGGVSTRHVQGIVESADLVLLCGGVLNDYTTVGWSALLTAQKTLHLDIKHCTIHGQRYPHVYLKHLLAAILQQSPLPLRPDSLTSFRRYVPVTVEPVSEVTVEKEQGTESPLSLRFLLQRVQSVMNSHVSSIVVEVGDAWFMGQKLKLPDGLKYHVQMQYGSCGWALGACLGVGMAQKNDTEAEKGGAIDNGNRNGNGKGASSPDAPPAAGKRMLALIGDGSFQFSAQELSTLIRNNINVTVLLLNNRTYTIEVQIHDGPYNVIPNWKYAELVNVLADGNVHALGVRATTNGELVQALERSTQHTGVMLIECCLGKDDCTSSLLEWGSRVAAANMAPA